jgi:hypothetical protein
MIERTAEQRTYVWTRGMRERAAIAYRTRVLRRRNPLSH